MSIIRRDTGLSQAIRGEAKAADSINGHYEIALSAENHEAADIAFQEAVSKGAVPVPAPVTEPWGQRTCYIANPEGNLVEIGSFSK